jgi:6-phosphogluconolactonase
MRDIRVCDDPARDAAERLAAAANAGEQIVLTGGSTPRRAYERLAAMPVDWTRCTLWFGDERCVPPTDERSNFGMVRDSLLDRLPEPLPDVRRLPGELGPDDGAAAYERELRAVFGDGIPRFDLLLLGLGPDGHCASLFPAAPALQERKRPAVGVARAGLAPFVPRVTLTLPVLNAARHVVFLVAGADKSDAVARAFGDVPDHRSPAGLVAPTAGTLTVLIDQAAAQRLPTATRPTRSARA